MNTLLVYRYTVGALVGLLLLLAACETTPAPPTLVPATLVTPTLVPATLAPPTLVPAPSDLSTPGERRTAGPVPTVGGYQLRITLAGQVRGMFNTDELRALPQQVLTMGGRDMSGAPVRQYLALSGITSGKEIAVSGTNSTRSGPTTVTLPWAATETLLLGVNQRGAGKLFGPDLPGEQWVVDVTEIAVTP